MIADRLGSPVLQEDGTALICCALRAQQPAAIRKGESA